MIEQTTSFGLDKNTCRVEKDVICKNKCRTKGVMLAAYNCGIICAYRELYSSESLSQVSIFLLDIISFSKCIPKYLIYACHLDEYLKHNKVTEISERGKTLQASTFVIDRLHIKNHVRENCHLNYNADLYDEMLKINTVVCEEANFWIGGFKHAMKHMNQERFNFFLYIMLNIYNEQKLVLNKKNSINQYK